VHGQAAGILPAAGGEIHAKRAEAMAAVLALSLPHDAGERNR
jgi:hypothetical protein